VVQTLATAEEDTEGSLPLPHLNDMRASSFRPAI
jgi:hypothetical protein